jgi:soluble lytic murein transglycosylase
MKKVLRSAVVGLVLFAAVAAVIAVIHRSMPGWYARLWYPLDHQELIVSNAGRYNLDPAMVAAVVFQESSFDSRRTSAAGATGLMQILPSTASWIEVQEQPYPPATGLTPSQPITQEQLADPEINIALGCWYLRYLIDRYGSVEAALAAYNGGAENVDGWIAEARAVGRDFNPVLDIPYRETRDYVVRVIETSEIYHRAYGAELGISA